MNAGVFSAELAENRNAYERSREQIRRAAPNQYAAIAHGRLIVVAESFAEAMAAIEQLQPPPEHFLAFPVDEEPAFDVIDDFSQRLGFDNHVSASTDPASVERRLKRYSRKRGVSPLSTDPVSVEAATES